MATFAKVSTPTISRFENGAKDIQLSSVLSILEVLGMVNQRRLDFPTATAKYLADKKAVHFLGQDGDKQIICEISREALDDHFDGYEKDPVKVFTDNRPAIEHEARRKYINGQIEAEGMILIKSEDL